MNERTDNNMRRHVVPLIYMPDGTIKQVNPFTETEVWYIPGRGNKPVTNLKPKEIKPLEKIDVENYCDFCEAKYGNTPPEKSRLINKNGKYETIEHLPFSELHKTKPLFRRIANLFEIVTIDYWKLNFDYVLMGKNLRWKNEYLSDPDGLNHILKVIHLKLRLSGKSDEQIKNMPIEEKLVLADALFGGGHDLVIAGRHFKENASFDNELWSSGEMNPDEHYEYIKFTVQAAQDIYANNRYVRYISIFQNWLAQAGASFNHLHKQLVSLDEWGTSVEREVALAQQNPNIYNEYAANYAGYHNLVFAENENAIAFISIGHRNPCIAIYSKSRASRPEEHSPEEMCDFSDLVHASHAALGSGVPSNEEWYYAPKDSIVPMPWHILIKLRINLPAGFEGGTKIYINPISPTQLRDQVVPRLFDLREAGRVRVKYIATECPVKSNSLRYYQGGGFYG